MERLIPLFVIVLLVVITVSIAQSFAEVSFDNEFAYPPQNTPDSNYQTSRGSTVAKVGDYEGALRFYDDALSQDPSNVVATGDKAVVFFELERLDESLDWTEKTLALDPNYAQALNNKGWFLYQNNETDEALQLFEKAINIDPNYVIAKKNTLAILVEQDQNKPKPETSIIDSGVVASSPESGSGENSETSFYDAIRPFVYLVVFVGVTYAMYYVKKRRQKHIAKTKRIINEPSFSVLKIRWGGPNITYQVVFDKNRLLFIRPDKLSLAHENASLDEILKMDKKNFQIPFDKIFQVELKTSKHGVNGPRAGKMTITYQNQKKIL